MFRKNVASQFIHFQGVDATTGGIKSGVSWTVRRCIDGTFAAGGGTVTEDGTTGWYKYAMSQADTNGNDIGFNFTGTGAVPQTINIVTTAADPTVGTNFGLSALPTANPGASGGLLIAGTNVATTIQGLTLAGVAASGSTPATAGLTATGGAASTTGGGVSAPAISATGGAGAASTNGAAAGATLTAGGTTTVSGNDGATFTGTGNGNGMTLAKAGTGKDLFAQTTNALQVDVNTIKTNPVANAGTVTFPTNATLASTTNITSASGVSLSAAGISAIWQDTTAGDFTAAGSIGKSIINGATLGNGLHIALVDTATAVTNAVTLSAGDSPVMQSGTASAGGASTITIASALGADSLPVGCLIKITGGTGANQARVITAYVDSTKVVTVDRAWTTQPNNTSVYSILYNELPALGASLKISGVVLTDTTTTVTNQLTAAAIATGVWTDATGSDFNAASSIGKTLYINNIIPGASGGLFIAGNNAATTVNITGNLSGSVGSVTGAVGSVTGNVGGNVNGNVLGNVSGSIGNVTNIVTAVWQDTTAGDFTVANSIGKSLYTSGNVPGTAGGIMIDGTNSGQVTFDAGLVINGSGSGDALALNATSNGSGILSKGCGTGSGIYAQSGAGATGDGMTSVAVSTDGNGISATGHGGKSGMLLIGGGSSGEGFTIVAGAGSGNGMSSTGGTTGGAGLLAYGRSNASGIAATGSNAGDGITATGGGGSGSGATFTSSGNAGININTTGSGPALFIECNQVTPIPGCVYIDGGISNGIYILTRGTGNGVYVEPQGTGNGVWIEGGATSGSGILVTTDNGDAVKWQATGGHGLNAIGNGSSKDGFSLTGDATGVGLAGTIGAISVDTYPEPGQGAPAATNTLIGKLGYLFKAWRNKSTQTSSEYDLYNDDTVTVDQKAAVSDDTVTFTRQEIASGP